VKVTLPAIAPKLVQLAAPVVVAGALEAATATAVEVVAVVTSATAVVRQVT
jgi:hypothetical protein